MKTNRIQISTLPNQIPATQIRDSIAYLSRKRADFSAYDAVEDLCFVWDESGDTRLKGFEYHFSNLRNIIARKLWSQGAFIGISVIESILFLSLKDASVSDPIKSVFNRIKDFGLHRNGFVLYPLHSFGVLDVGLRRFFNPEPVYVILPEAGIAICPQTNSEKGLLDFLQTAIEKLHIKHEIPIETMEHFFRSGGSGYLKWMTNNPVLIVRSRVFSGTYFENQFLLLAKLKMAVAFAIMLFSFQKNQNNVGNRRFFSTSSLNNWETLDFKHYLVFQAPVKHRRAYSVQRVPMNVSKPELAEISELNIELDPKEWRRRPKLLNTIRMTLATIESGYLNHCIGNLTDTVQRRVYFKLFDATNHYRRSFRQSSNIEQNIISLTVSFETLLTDSYSNGVEARIIRRVGILVKGIPGSRKMKSAVKDLYHARSESVHKGTTIIVPDWSASRQAFVYSLINICKRLHKLPTDLTSPIGDILGD